MKYLVIIIISLVLITSCGKKEDLIVMDKEAGRPAMPVDANIDVNADQLPDFAINYQELATSDMPSSAGSIIGSVYPLNQNKILYRNGIGSLFMNVNDTIRKTSNTNSFWQEYGADLISIHRADQKWDSTWTVLSDEKPFYFLAYNLIVNGSEEIGWISLMFDKETGKISITDGDRTLDNELIIYKKVTY